MSGSIQSAVKTLFGLRPTLVFIDPKTGALQARTFLLPDEKAALADRLRRCGEQGLNVYFHLNEGSRPHHKQAAADIVRLVGVGADIDAKDGVTLSDIESRIAALPVTPTLIVMTGGGYQAFWLFPEPLDAAPDTVAHVTALGRRIGELLEGDAVFNIDRLYRMPGTTNYPDARKRARGRVSTVAKLSGGSGQAYDRETLERAFPPAASQPSRPVATLNAALMGGLSSGGWFDDLPPDRKDACLAAMLAIPEIAALADTSDGAPEPNWRTVLAACARSGAPNARSICRDWASASPRFNASNFDARFRSYGVR